MAFCLYRSNRVERLGEALGEVVRKPLSSAFARECVVVQGPGMERWLSSFLATKLDVWANPWFPFPRALVELALDTVLGEVPEDERWYEPEKLSWLIARLLPTLLDDPALRTLASYLRDDAAGERLLGVASELAAAYDQCLVYRPDVVLGWERGLGNELHPTLWRALRRVATTPHLATRLQAFDRAVAEGRVITTGARAFPERVSLFGISTLPPAFLSVLSRLSEQVDVHFFLLTPSQEYWGDFDRKLAQKSDLHGLLASLGKVGRDLIELLEEVPHHEPMGELFETPQVETMLSGLQADLATLTARGPGTSGAPRSAHEHDDSIAVHVCHSPVRELEVLRDQLRARFERDPSLSPHDVVVLAPDVERYASAIHAVFAAHGDDDRRFIPYHVADRKASRLSLVNEAFFAVLDLVPSRLGLSEVLDLLQQEPVRLRFGLDEGELEQAETWLREAGARWAIDAAHRASFGQPPFPENTLRFATERLLLGYASVHGQRSAFGDVLPYAEIEGRDALVVGKVVRYLEQLFVSVRELEAPRPVADFGAALSTMLERMISDARDLASEHQALKAALSALVRDAEQAGMEAPVSLAAVRRELLARLDRRRASVGFLSGGITFCEHVPMRAIPFRVVALLGMDDESFPRRKKRSPFDILREEPRRGDRSLRDDDRQLFLEALLSAREALLITYVGRSAKDDAVRPASVLVDRLLALVDRHFVLAGDGAALRLGFEGSVAGAITHVHALHRFDPRYFRVPPTPGFVSFDESACAAARALSEPSRGQRPFVRAPLPPREGSRSLTLDGLVRFFRHPQRAFLEERLGVHLVRDEERELDREPTVLGPLEHHQVGDDLLHELRDVAKNERARILRQEGRLPPGTLGELGVESVEREVSAILRTHPEDVPPVDLPIVLELCGVRLVGRVEGVVGTTRIERTFSKLKGRHVLGAWIRHLAYCAAHEQPGESVVVLRGKSEDAEEVRFRPVPKARALLEDLVSIRALGLCAPLPFFADAGYDAARLLAKGKPHADAMEAARKSLFRQQGVGARAADDPCVTQLFTTRELEHLDALAASDGTRTLGALELVEHIVLPLFTHVAGDDA